MFILHNSMTIFIVIQEHKDIRVLVETHFLKFFIRLSHSQFAHFKLTKHTMGFSDWTSAWVLVVYTWIMGADMHQDLEEAFGVLWKKVKQLETLVGRKKQTQ